MEQLSNISSIGGITMKHSIVFSGNTVIWLGQDEAKIIEQMNKQLERFYGDQVKVVSARDLGKDELEIKVERKLNGRFFLDGGWINYIDESIITGLSEEAFVPGEHQLLFPIVPFGDAFFGVDEEFYKLYIRQIKVYTNEIAEEVQVLPTPSDLTITVRYKDTTPRRYKQDVLDMTQKYGNLWLLRGQTIRTTLQDFSQVCTRNQPKVSAYRGLKNFLLDAYNITLELTSNKTKE
jgi:hypothetical protein